MYHSGGGRTGGKGKAAWRAPTTVEKMSYKKFKEAADRCDQNNCSETEQHFYFRVTAPAAGHFIFKELPFFKPKASIFIKVGSLATGRQCHARTPSQAKPSESAHARITPMFDKFDSHDASRCCCLHVLVRCHVRQDPKGQRGIHCRFGMREVIAENHYDGSRNTIGLFGGRRRYVLSHPKVQSLSSSPSSMLYTSVSSSPP